MRATRPYPDAHGLHPWRYFIEIMAAFVVLAMVVALSPARAAEPAPGVLDTGMNKVLVVRSADNANRFLGSAFLWGEMAEVAVTNAHVVGEAGQVRLVDRQGHEAVAVVIARDEVRDIAVIGLPGTFAGRAGFVAGETPALGAAVWAMGAPLGIEFTLTEGMVSAAPRQVEITVPIRMIQHDAAVNPGSSGGPLVDSAGHLVGMNSRIADGSRMFVGIAYAITAEDISRLAARMISEDLLPFPKLEMRARPVDRQISAALGVDAAGLLIDAVVPGGMAGAAGLRAGDVILAVDGVAIQEPGDFAFLIESAQVRDQADLAIFRSGQAIVVMMDLGTQSDDSATLIKRAAPGAEAARIASYGLDALGLEIGAEGRVKTIRDNSPALWAGLAVGDRIMAINGTAMNPEALSGFVMTAPALLLVRGAGGQTRHVLIDPWASVVGLRPVGGANVLDPAVVVF